MGTHARYRHKHFLLTSILALFLWVSGGYFIFSVAPTTIWVIVAFFLLISGALFLTTSLVLGNSRHGLLAVFMIIGYLLLRLLHQDIVVNMILLASLTITIEIYFRQKNK